MVSIPKEYQNYIVCVLVVLVVLYALSHFYEGSDEMFGIGYVGTPSSNVEG